MPSLLHRLADTRKADFTLFSVCLLLFVGGFWLAALPAWFVFGIGPIAAAWSVFVFLRARSAHEHEVGPLAPRTVPDTLRLLGAALICAGAIAVLTWFVLR